jgi:hypothetical protein
MRDRTADLLDANQALSQLSYSPIELVFGTELDRLIRSQNRHCDRPKQYKNIVFNVLVILKAQLNQVIEVGTY